MLGPDDLIAAARRHGLELSLDSVDESGLDFLVAHGRDAAGTRWVVRSPRRPDVAAAAEREARVLSLVKGRIGVAVPDWKIHTAELIAYPRLDGTPAVTLDTGAPVWNFVDPAAPSERFLDTSARVLAALQSLDAFGIDTQPDVREHIRQRLDTVRATLQPTAALWARWQRWLDGDTWPTHVALVHGDLHPGHLLLGEDGAIVGILDWTEATVSDPAIDLAMWAGAFGRPALERLVTRFAAHGGRTWPALVDHAMERWSVFPALIAAWAVEHDNEDALAFARGLLAQADGA